MSLPWLATAYRFAPVCQTSCRASGITRRLAMHISDYRTPDVPELVETVRATTLEMAYRARIHTCAVVHNHRTAGPCSDFSLLLFSLSARTRHCPQADSEQAPERGRGSEGTLRPDLSRTVIGAMLRASACTNTGPCRDLTLDAREFVLVDPFARAPKHTLEPRAHEKSRGTSCRTSRRVLRDSLSGRGTAWGC
jgi:hypothetical protein